MPLAVIERKGVAGVAFAPGIRQAGGGIQAAAQQAYGVGHYDLSVAAFARLVDDRSIGRIAWEHRLHN
jgi:hypothetical protein